MGFPFQISPQGFKTRLLGERLPHPYKECFVPLSNRCGISQSTPPSGPSILASTHSPLLSMWIHPFQGLASSLAHHSVPSSDAFCNIPIPPLANIVLFELPFRASHQSFKTRLLRRDFHTLIKNVLFSSTTYMDPN